MALFRITVPVASVSGNQHWLVEAEDEERAKAVYRAGGGRFEFDDIEVMELEDISTIEEITLNEIEVPAVDRRAHKSMQAIKTVLERCKIKSGHVAAIRRIIHEYEVGT